MAYRKDGSLAMTPEWLEATTYHVTMNQHHPEYYDINAGKKRFANPSGRLEIVKKIIDATSMPEQYLLEMAADWCAVAEERRTNPHDWANRNIGTRWLFTKKQEQIINCALVKAWGY